MPEKKNPVFHLSYKTALLAALGQSPARDPKSSYVSFKVLDLIHAYETNISMRHHKNIPLHFLL